MHAVLERVVIHCIVRAAMDDTCQYTQTKDSQICLLKMIISGAPAHCIICRCSQLKPYCELDLDSRETGQNKSGCSVYLKTRRACYILFLNMLMEFAFDFLYMVIH